MKDLLPHNLRILSGPTPPRRVGERCFGRCASLSPEKKSLRTRLPLRGFWAKKRRLSALPKRSKTFKIKGMYLTLRVPLLLLACFLIFGGAQGARAEETPAVAEETPAKKEVRETNEAAAKARADADAAAQAQIVAANAQIQKLKDEIAAQQKT